MPQTLIKISVGSLVGFGLRAGDLVGTGFIAMGRGTEGTRGHQRVQQARPYGYQAEVPLTHQVEAGDLTLEIGGRADGVLDDGHRLLVEEIKTTRRPLDQPRPENPFHWGQAKVYAYILALQARRQEVEVQVTYVHLETGQLLEDRRVLAIGELEAFFTDLVDRYLAWARRYHEWCRTRDRSIRVSAFPFPVLRPGQRALMARVERTIAAQGRLFVQAPTGIGKTVSVLYPAVQALADGRAEKVFYLTAKTSGRQVAEKALADMRRVGLCVKGLTLTARDRICLQPESERACDPEVCPFARGYFDRVGPAVEELFGQDALTRAAIERAAWQYQVCPFELSLELALWADVVICDYNYVFDPRAYLRRFFLERVGAYLFLVDEAHNLADRAREMFSAQLSKLRILSLKRAVAGDHPRLAQALQEANGHLLEVGHRCAPHGAGEVWLERQPPEAILPILQRLQREAEAVLTRSPAAAYEEELADCYFAVLGFQRIAELFDARYVCCAEKDGREVRLRLFCLDPSEQIRQALRRGSAAVFFSATLTPLDYFRRILGGEEDDDLLDLETPFPPENLHVVLVDHIDTTYRRRDQSYDAVAEAIAAAISQRSGNYMAYFPSYQYLQEVLGRFQQRHADVRTRVQRPGMAEPEREEFLAGFAADNPETLVGFAVLGGVFGEGIDLVGERLVGASIVGVGLPQLCLERDLIRSYFDEQGIPGFDFAYTYPGMNRVLQAAGRVIRSDEDRGVVLLIDQRFRQTRYRRLMPASWRGARAARSPARIAVDVEAFWCGRTPEPERGIHYVPEEDA